jgi:hypothetical protein
MSKDNNALTLNILALIQQLLDGDVHRTEQDRGAPLAGVLEMERQDRRQFCRSENARQDTNRADRV